jgi:thymidylate synthase (FAD)
MPEATLKVKLISMTENPISVIYASCKQCYSANFAGDIFEEVVNDSSSLPKQIDFVERIMASGHQSPLEHVNFTFAIEGVSRACTHQLVRHRIASYSQQSQRYVKEKDFDYVIPPTIKKDERLLVLFENFMKDCQKRYSEIVEGFKQKNISGEKAYQDARFILPNAAETKIVVTMNARELLHFFNVRCCARSQWELRHLAEEMLKIVKEKLPAIFGRSGAKCENLGYCPEGEKFTCGRYPLKEDVIISYKSKVKNGVTV